LRNSSKKSCRRILASARTLLLAGIFAATAFASVEAEKQLKDPDAKVREKAARQLGQEDNPANVSILATAVQDKDEKVRLAVVKALVHLGSPAALEPLSKAVGDGFPEIRSLAIDGLVNFYLPGYIDTGFSGFFRGISSKVEGLFSNVDTTVVAADVKVDPKVVRTLALSLDGAPDMATRVRAGRALGILRAADAVPELLKASFSNNVDLIVTAMGAFDKIKDTSVGPRITFLLNYPQKSVQVAAAGTLGVLRTEEAIPNLERLFQSSPDDKEVRAAALEALAFMPTKETTPLFVKNLNDKEKPIRTSSAMGLGRLRDPSFAGALEKANAAEKDAGVRLALDFALVNIGKMDSLGELVSNLTSRVHRGEARPYLIELARDKAVRDALKPYLYSKEDDIRENLCEVYGASGDSSSIADLEVLLRDRKADVAEEASRAIRLIRARGN
jgi:HEAT repeat protein